MKRAIMSFAAITIAGTAFATDVAPGNVVFEDGAVSQSLSGVAGNPEEGRKYMNKGAGNCIACHEVTALAEWPFHGEIGPTLDGVADRWSEAELRGIVTNAKMTFEDSMMPSFYKVEGFLRPGNGFTGKAADGPLEPMLSAQEIEDVVAYLMTLSE